MRIKITLKDPDALHDALSNHWTNEECNTPGSDADKAYGIISANWMQYGEYITIEFDLETKTAVVKQNGKKR